MKKELRHSTIKFDYEGKPTKFEVVHNLEEFGMSIENAFINWAARDVDQLSLIDFCNYVESKDINFICHPKYRREVSASNSH